MNIYIQAPDPRIQLHLSEMEVDILRRKLKLKAIPATIIIAITWLTLLISTFIFFQQVQIWLYAAFLICTALFFVLDQWVLKINAKIELEKDIQAKLRLRSFIKNT